MAIGPTRLGPYEVTGSLGAGGMGEVYRARDTKLERDVAIKILPESLAQDPDRLARFEREAKTLAALNHPHIAQVYGFEDSGTVRALVMELVPGESLAARLARGPMPLRDALELSRQIADGLEAAHDKGIVHRDLKPANIQVTPDGQVKILDFGLAKALVPETSASVTDSPTVTAGTRHGVILGTAAYMSPEQARGLPVDARTDSWAFGGVLYEMLTGARAFPGATATDVLVAILERDPDWAKLPATTPPAVRALVQRCLRKDRKQRLHDVADARFTIEEALAALSAGTSGVGVDASGVSAIPAPPPRAIWRGSLSLLHALLTLALAGALVWVKAQPPGPTSREPMHFALTLPLSQDLADRYPTISPNGEDIIYVAVAEEGPPGPEGNVPRLYHRRLTDAVGRALPGTEGATAPFFSPDGAWVAFTSMVDTSLKKIALAGGGPVVVANLSGEAVFDLGPGSWSGAGEILLPSEAGPVLQVTLSDGAIAMPVPRGALQTAERGMRFPTKTRDGGALLFVPLRPGGGLAAWVANERRELLRAAFQPQITRDGQLLFLRRVNPQQVDLCAVAIDQAHASLSGEPVPVLSLDASGGSGYAMAADGTLVYKAAQSGIYQAPHTWVSAGQSSATPLGKPREDVVVGAAARVSPDGQHVVFGSGDGARIHVLDLAGGTRSVVVPAGPVWWPIWSHDGQRIIYSAGPGFRGGAGLFWKRVDGSGPGERLTTGSLIQMAQAVTGDGRFLVYSEFEFGTAGASKRSRDTRSDLWALPLTPRGQPRPLVQTKADEGKASISPDGRWLAYTSDETGRSEVWVRPFPDGTVSTQASPDGGTEPLWAPDGRTLYYRDSGGVRLLALPVASGPVPQFGVPVARIGHWNPPVPSTRLYDITPDGSALLMPPAPTYGRDLGLILHFDELIRRKLAEAGQKTDEARGRK